MSESLSEQAQQVLAHAQHEARSLNHNYVGTEHLLLGLLHDNSGTPAITLQALGLSLATVRLEIEKLIQRGTTPPLSGQLPLTPRAKRALTCAAEEARLVNQKQIGAEHLLLGLFCESDGVAGQVLRHLGINLEKLRLQTVKLRLLQMTIVERIVRPIHAATPRKRKIREELLAHLETIYEQELPRTNDSTAALHTAAQRLGNPAALARDFEKALPAHERFSYRLERLFGWRAPESVAKFMFRVVVQYFAFFAPLFGVALLNYMVRFGWDDGAWVQLRVSIALLFIGAASMFLLGVLHFKLRDTLWGVFGSPRSRPRVFGYAVLIALVTLVSSFGFIALISWTVSNATLYLDPYCAAAAFAAVLPITSYIAACHNGPIEITDTRWACLDVQHLDSELNE